MYLLKKFSCVLITMLLSGMSNVFGFSVNPLFLDMQPNGSKARGTITVSSSSPKPMPLNVSVSELTLDINGKPRAVVNNNDFLIFPPRAVLKPYGKQTFRVQWRGRPNLQQGKTYEIIVGQVLAKDKRTKKPNEGVSLSVQFAVAFSSIVNMRAAVGIPQPMVKASRLSRNRLGRTMLDTTISNGSNQNFLMVQADSTVTTYGVNNQRLWSYTYSPDEMMRNFGLGVVQPGKTRRMKIPLPNYPKNLVARTKRTNLEVRPSAK